MVSFDHQSNILLQRIVVILSESIFWFKIQDIIRDVSLGKKDNWGLFVSLKFWVWLTYLAVCPVSRQKLLYLPSWLSGSSFLSLPFPSLVLGDSVYSCSLIFPIVPSLTPSLFPLPDLYVRVHVSWGTALKSPCSAAWLMQIPARDHFPFSEVGWRRLCPPGRRSSRSLLFGTCGQSSLGLDTQTVWEEVAEKVQTCLYLGLSFRSKFIGI